jgi:Ca2+-transporting ATPase
MNKPPRHPKESIFANGLWFYILWVGFLTGAISFGMQIYGINSNSHWQTMVFATICFSQLGLVLTIRSDSQSLFKIGIFSNMYVIFVIVFTIILQFATIYVPFFNSIFKTEPLSLKEILVVLGVSLIVFFTVELHKLFLRLREKRKIVVENFKT